ncbi:MAG: hypothetical protein JW891_13695 [Candidatus Lokiarchaeota archaeon]|nr:hypothetical protein [Candidatus Lokiarchaeota archaeon]
MKEKVHQGLARLVIRLETVQINFEQARKIVHSSIQPDVLNKQEIEKNILNTPQILWDWWKDHSLQANNLAIIYIQEAQKAYRQKQSIWTRYLGWAFHFITDRLTPYHSPDKLNPVINSINGQFKKGFNALKGFKLPYRLSNGILFLVSKFSLKALSLKVDHDHFEKICEQKWLACKDLTSLIFQNLKKNKSLIINLELIKKKLEYLYEKYKNISTDWIITDKNYANYMAEIAFIMHLVYQYVLGINK